MFGGGRGGFSDFFENIFGGMGAGRDGGTRQRRSTRGHDLQGDISITLEDAYHGATKVMTVNGQQMRIALKPGIADRQVLKLGGKGAPGRNGQPDDLYLTVHVAMPPNYAREGDDLFTTVSVPLYTALLGGNIEVQTPGGPVRVKIPPETQSGARLRLRGKGMPHYGQTQTRGDLYVIAEVALPRNLSEKEKELIAQLAQMRQNP